MIDVRQHLRTMIAQWAAVGQPAMIERFVLHAGAAYESAALPAEYEHGEPKQCFQNATKLIWRNSRALTYCEGFVVDPDIGFPILHAWAVTKRGVVIDNTLRTPEANSYFGVRFTRYVLNREIRASGVYGLLDHGRGANVALIERLAPDVISEARAVAPALKRKTR